MFPYTPGMNSSAKITLIGQVKGLDSIPGQDLHFSGTFSTI